MEPESPTFQSRFVFLENMGTVANLNKIVILDNL